MAASHDSDTVLESSTDISVKDLAVEEAELQHELEVRLNTVNHIQNSLVGLKEDIKWCKLEQKWINHVTQVGEEMLRLLLELNNDQEINELDSILQPLLMRRSELRARVIKLREEMKNV